MAAAPSGNPGCPLFAFCTASTERKRSVLTQSSSSETADFTVRDAGLMNYFLEGSVRGGSLAGSQSARETAQKAGSCQGAGGPIVPAPWHGGAAARMESSCVPTQPGHDDLACASTFRPARKTGFTPHALRCQGRPGPEAHPAAWRLTMAMAAAIYGRPFLNRR